IRRLDIEEALLGTSLLEYVALDLFSSSTFHLPPGRQPFQENGIALYGTSTNLCTQSALILGGNGLHPDAPYDFLEAALASSAFPAVFAPRPESHVFPVTGRADVLLADGGMFDNLPFLPAIEILSRAQQGYRQTVGATMTVGDFLDLRLGNPDLLIAGALNAVPELEEGAADEFSTLAAVQRRAKSLHHNVKIRVFELASRRIHSQLQRLK